MGYSPWGRKESDMTEWLSLSLSLLSFSLGTFSCIFIDFPGGSVIKKEKERKKVKSFSRVRLFATPWTVAYQAPPSMEFSRQEYWSGLPFPSPGDFPDPGIESGSPALQADSLPSEPPGKTPMGRWQMPT